MFARAKAFWAAPAKAPGPGALESLASWVKAVLPDGSTFDSPAGLRVWLMRYPEQIVTAATEKLLAYALGRGVDYTDASRQTAIVTAFDAVKGSFVWDDQQQRFVAR